jgi:AcrR family transcriptional regulator
VSSLGEDGSTRQGRRKAQTRAKIAAAANELFSAHGYAETSMDDIAAHADVAMRTIYLHFESKAAVLLAYVDDWIEAFTDAILARPVHEPIGVVVEAAVRELQATGRSSRNMGQAPIPHPVIELLGSGPVDISGHMLHTWTVAQDRIAADAVRRGGYPPGALEPRARAAAIFASWLATVLAFRDAYRHGGVSDELSDHEAGARIAKMFSAGSL